MKAASTSRFAISSDPLSTFRGGARRPSRSSSTTSNQFSGGRHAEHEAHPIRRIAFKLEAAKMLRYERAAVGRFDHVIAVSEYDREQMKTMTDSARISVVPTGVDLRQYQAAAGESATEPVVMFLGSMDWEANVDGVTLLLPRNMAAGETRGARSAIPHRRAQPGSARQTTRFRRHRSDRTRGVGDRAIYARRPFSSSRCASAAARGSRFTRRWRCEKPSSRPPSARKDWTSITSATFCWPMTRKLSPILSSKCCAIIPEG